MWMAANIERFRTHFTEALMPRKTRGAKRPGHRVPARPAASSSGERASGADPRSEEPAMSGQLTLNLSDIPIPEMCLWEQFDDEQKQILIETLAFLLLKAVGAPLRSMQISSA
jgi:hypothetical protein